MKPNQQQHPTGQQPLDLEHQTQPGGKQPPTPPAGNDVAVAAPGGQQPKKRGQMPYDEDALAKMILKGDLSRLTDEERTNYYWQVCDRLGLDPLTQPFRYLLLNSKLILYCDRSGAQQLNKLHGISHEIRLRENIGDCYAVTARATMPNGRFTESIGAVGIGNLKGDNLSNALMKAETKAKRRATLDLVGLGILDETETETIAGAQRVEPRHGNQAAAPAPQMNMATTEPPKQQPATNGQPDKPGAGITPPPQVQRAPAQQPPQNNRLAAARQAMEQAGVKFQTADDREKACKKKYQTAGQVADILEVCVTDVKQLANLYYVNAELVEENPKLKELFTKKKNEYFTNAPAHQIA